VVALLRSGGSLPSAGDKQRPPAVAVWQAGSGGVPFGRRGVREATSLWDRSGLEGMVAVLACGQTSVLS
jgi:hypothetical protein